MGRGKRARESKRSHVPILEPWLVESNIQHLIYQPSNQKFVAYIKGNVEGNDKYWLDYRDAPKEWPRIPEYGYLIYKGERTENYPS